MIHNIILRIGKFLVRNVFAKREVLSIFSLIACVDFSGAVFATENAGEHYPLGVLAVVPGILPPEGTYLFNYSVGYYADRLNDENGHSFLPGFHVHSAIDAMRFVQTWDAKFLGADVVSEFVLPVIDAYAENAFHAPQEKFGIGDINVAPAELAWHSSDLHVFVGPRIFLPTGGYNKTDLVNLGLNYYTFGGSVGISWFPLKDLQIGAHFFTDTSTKNNATDYQSGDEMTADYVVTYQITPKLNVGLNGYYYDQFTGDTVSGKPYRNGFEGQTLAIGPMLRYNFSDRLGLVAKFDHEVFSYNRPQGERFWLQFVVPLDGGGRLPSTLGPK